MAKRAVKKSRVRRTRDARAPRETAFTGAILLAFMVVVFFLAPKALPLFFQRLVGVTNALLAMAVAMFAVREFGGRFNSIPITRHVRVSTSKLAGLIVFLLVFLWWTSQWAPIAPVVEPPPAA